jgi:hypothetical protein
MDLLEAAKLQFGITPKVKAKPKKKKEAKK